MNDWIPIDLDKVSTEPIRVPDDVHIELYLSPFAIPEAVRGRFDKKQGKFFIEFRYSSNEPTLRERQNDDIALHVGKRSGRLYGIEVNVEHAQAKSVTLTTYIPKKISETIKRLANDRPDYRGDNFRVTNEVVDDRRDLLFRDLATVS